MSARGHQRRLPFLHRNWTTGLTACQEWTPKRRRLAPAAIVPNDHDDEAYGRTSKRRRVGAAADGMDNTLRLPDDPADRSNGLRVQVFHVLHKDTPRLRFASNAIANTPPSAITKFNARFKVTILSEKCGLPQLMCCAPQIGTIETFEAAHCPRGIARLVLKPFTIPLEQIAIFHKESDIFGLADKYKLRVEIESAASNAAWPPLDLLSLAEGDQKENFGLPKNTGDCVLYAESNDFFGRPRMRIPLWLRESPQHDPVFTQFVMDMDVRWSTGFIEQPTKKNLHLGVLPSIVALHPDEPLPPPTLDFSQVLPRRSLSRTQSVNRLVNGGAALSTEYTNGSANGTLHYFATNGSVNGTTNGSSGHANGSAEHRIVDDVESLVELDHDDAEGESMASRSLRARRDQPEYNVRSIINKAHGIGPRAPRRRQHKSALDSHHHAVNGINGNRLLTAKYDVKITYVFPPEKLKVDGFVCCICMASNPDVNHLRAHLLIHSHYDFEYETHLDGSDGHIFTISRAVDDSDTDTRRRPSVFQLGRPSRPLDLEKFLSGDDSWVTTRYGPQHNDKVTAPVSRPPPRQKLKPQPPQRKVLVPFTKQPLYDPLSKALLQPGTVLRPTVVDESWRIHKHREIVQDYTDLTPAEKEFIQEWDRFIILKHVASEAYIPRAMVQFIQEKGPWLVADLARTVEFGKLMAVMVARDILADTDIDNVTRALNAARKRAQEGSKGKSNEPAAAAASDSASKGTSPPRWTANRCSICGHRCSGPEMMICSNRECPRRLYHTTCLDDKAKVDMEERDEWYCNECAHLADPAHLVRPL